MIGTQQELDGKKYEIQHFIEYCIRLSSKEKYDVVEESVAPRLTFDQLKRESVTVESLIKWSSEIDLIERYQHFLDTNNFSSMELFYNCAASWFGSFCQYRFALNQTFTNIADITFNSKRILGDYANCTCYVHMKCNRGSPLICLDWCEMFGSIGRTFLFEYDIRMSKWP
ncbi:unnamed protein product [Rotaria socialis]|uniref:Uncharacterized protein n=1 Tax=Rotaria socialis TaxID=392032 RepID=A0A818GZR6_9BILA|nr:unnamed protein product [Rotaria socialis]CAF4972118.1 unnamed protein product [Rotaria socialis]